MCAGLRRNRPWTTAQLRLLYELYKGGLADAAIAARLGRSEVSVSRQRQRMRFLRCPPWTPGEDVLLRGSADRGLTDSALAKQLGRSVRAIQIRRSRMRLSRRSESLTLQETARILGQRPRAIERLVASGQIKAYRRKGPQSAKSEWVFTYEALYDFVADPDAWHMYDPARITHPYLRAYAYEQPRPRYLTTSEVARRMFFVHRTVLYWVQRGLFPGARKTGSWRIPETELEGFTPPSTGGRRAQ